MRDLLYLLPIEYKKKSTSRGTDKDISNMLDYFEHKKIIFKIGYISNNFFQLNDFKLFIQILKKKPKMIFFEKYLNFKFIFYIFLFKILFFKTKIFYRSHNAELFHRYDHLKAFLRSNFILKKNIGFFFYIKNILVVFLKEIILNFISTKIFSVNSWEKENYWKYFPAKCEVLHPFVVKENIQLNQKYVLNEFCLVPCALPNNIIADDQIIEFIKQIEFFSNKKIKYIFTGDINIELKKFLSKKAQSINIEIYFINEKRNFYFENKLFKKIDLGFNHPLSYTNLLRQTNKSLIISELGYGVKTKILELLNYNHKIFVNNVLYKRLEDSLQKSVFSINYIKNDFARIYNKCKINQNINYDLKKKYFQTLDNIL
jgi:hypothetical protein